MKSSDTDVQEVVALLRNDPALDELINTMQKPGVWMKRGKIKKIILAAALGLRVPHLQLWLDYLKAMTDHCHNEKVFRRCINTI